MNIPGISRPNAVISVLAVNQMITAGAAKGNFSPLAAGEKPNFRLLQESSNCTQLLDDPFNCNNNNNVNMTCIGEKVDILFNCLRRESDGGDPDALEATLSCAREPLTDIYSECKTVDNFSESLEEAFNRTACDEDKACKVGIVEFLDCTDGIDNLSPEQAAEEVETLCDSDKPSQVPSSMPTVSTAPSGAPVIPSEKPSEMPTSAPSVAVTSGSESRSYTAGTAVVAAGVSAAALAATLG